ncbi:MAG: DUF2911 domain-containing protein [Gilvibacter sp.]
MKNSIVFISLLLATSLCFGQRLETPSLSPFSKASQEVGLAQLSLEYSRPSAKGRAIFGSLVPYDKIWRTGANASTKITINDSAQIAGNWVNAGTYALYTIPSKEKWTVIIHRNTSLRSLAGDAYNSKDDLFRFEVAPITTDHYTETFTLQFAWLTTNSVQLQLLWENTQINIPIKVDVDTKIAQQMASFLTNADEVPHRTYFEAAQYYLNNNKSIMEAMAYINEALVKSPENFRYGLLKARIQDQAGAHQAAMITIEKANAWAVKAKNDNYIEQTSLFKAYLKDKKN